ncbi:neutral/alkaline non-lysosomal ceramidase N-terminal domain-containing protein [Pullulanibacillus camelliae]|uniref:neutral/alkaline non-lysosomal ceramidase N-terminal domain-containing protein n=1 Tax=Pullulanibacillus camelliae TaxID=1707096 RepID=UPI001667B58B|nr:neutral/alkaline non-lysosomal ceramidase N-terminal domain-containing protein [Pullulanibacillus camelliae]
MSKIGLYTIDITPPLGIDFIGYHRDGGIKGILDRIYATAFVFENQGEKIVLISVDNIGLSVGDTTQLRVRISEKLQIEIDNVTVICTHTHSGPETEGKVPLHQAYKTVLFENLFQAVFRANEALQPCNIGWGVTKGEIGVNRRQIVNGKAIMGTNLDGIVDKRIGVLGIKNNDTNEMIGVIIFCTAHPNVLRGDSFLLSGDYPGKTKQILEQTLSCPVVVIQGGAGNINAKWRGTQDDLKKMAQALSGYVLTVLPDIDYRPISKMVSVSKNLSMKLKRIPDPKDIDKIALSAEKKWGVNTTKWKTEILNKYKENQRELEVDLEVQLIQLNEGFFSGIPMEPFAETALEIRDSLENDFAFFGGYTNGYLGYLPNRESYPYGGYEVEINPVVYGPETGLWMSPHENTAEQVVKTVLNLYKSNN